MSKDLEKLKKLWGIQRLTSPFVTKNEMDYFLKCQDLIKNSNKKHKKRYGLNDNATKQDRDAYSDRYIVCNLFNNKQIIICQKQ